MKLISGRNFRPEVFTNTNMVEDQEVHDLGKEVILNEEAAKLLGFDPFTAPGKFVSHLHNGIVYTYRVAGVAKSYHYSSLHSAIGPCAIMNVNPLRCNNIIAKVDGHQILAAIHYTIGQWKKLNPDTPVSYHFLNDIFQDDYLNDQREEKMISVFTAVAIFISCLGLLGLITYSVAQKAREIGIRKVIGASVSGIVLLFSKQYLKLVIVANLVALPLAWYTMNRWLIDFHYRIAITWWMFAGSFATGLIICFGTIAFKTIKAARANPVDSLRVE